MSARRPRARFVLDHAAYDLVYGPEQLEAVAASAEIIGDPLSATELAGRPGALADVEVVLSGWGAPLMDAAFLERAPALSAVFYGAGAVRSFVTDAFFARGVRLSSANDANAIPVSEYALGVILFSLKHGWRLIRERPSPSLRAAKLSPGAYHSTVGIIGLGAIGRIMVERLSTFELHIIAYDPYCSPADAALAGVELVGLDELFARSDVASLHAPLYEATRGMLTAELFSSMPPGATFVNTARGAIVRHDELAGVLAVRPDLQAVLDVTYPEPLPADHPLLELANVVITPHVAGSIGPECRRLGDLVAAELARYVAGVPLAHEVDPSGLGIAAQP